MKQVEIVISNKDVEIKSKNLSSIVQIMRFMGREKFNRIKEEYVNFCLNTILEFQFCVGDFYIYFLDVNR